MSTPYVASKQGVWHAGVVTRQLDLAAHRQLECAVLARRRNKVAISNMDSCTPHPFYQCIAPLRWDNHR